MFTRKIIDYTTLPTGTITRHGEITICKHCGKPGTHITATAKISSIEKTQYKLFEHFGPSTSCTYSIVIGTDGKRHEGWSTSDINR
uniref:Uncharacterized protein n=1 Tax=Thermosporothrix sp. COM3 TaxID=2490863 RepID=A0A455SGJ9_9CHLR|nr:hypothetical protein KTC_12020 [Thermosporothrix sp. COM3]